MKSVKFTDYIEYDKEDYELAEQWKCTIASVIRNIKKYFPKVAKAKRIYTNDGVGIEFFSDDIDTLKKLWISLSFIDGDNEYNKLVKNGKLEYELDATDFYGCLN